MKTTAMRLDRAWIALAVALTALAVGCVGSNSDEQPESDEPIAEIGAALTGDPCTGNAECNDGNPCTVDRCVQSKCAYTTKADGSSCNDGNACTKTDTCKAGVCAGGAAVVCAAPNQCQTATGCNPSNGRCVYFAKAGTACDDGNSCTENDQCSSSTAGVCRGARRSRGSACDDNNSCTHGDQCTSGGICSGTAQPNGATCDDGNSNTAGDVCTSGVCSGVDQCVGVTCTASDQCHVAGLCVDHATGACSNPNTADATTCDDNNPNTMNDLCTGGICSGTANPCLANNGGCSPNATCTLTSGSRTCACNTGFTGDGVTCILGRSGEDTTPPTLTALSFSPTSIDTTGAPASVQASFTVADDLSGIVSVGVLLQSPSGTQYRSCSWSTPGQPYPLISINGCSIPFAQFGEGGTWVVNYVQLYDAVGNRRVLYTADLQAAGFPTTLGVASNQDSTGPVLQAFSLSPSSIDTTGAPASVQASFTVADDLSGIVSVGVLLQSPSGTQYRSCSWSTPGQPYPLTAINGCSIPFAQFGEGGTWVVNYVQLYDAVGNRRVLYTADLQAAGFSTTLGVASNQDSTGPVLQAFSLSPSSIDTTGAPASVQASFTVADDLSGIVSVGVLLQSPSGTQYRSCSWSTPGQPYPLISINGCSIPFAQFGEGGTWVVNYVQLYDAVGNRRVLYTADLRAAGFSTTLGVNGGS